MHSDKTSRRALRTLIMGFVALAVAIILGSTSSFGATLSAKPSASNRPSSSTQPTGSQAPPPYSHKPVLTLSRSVAPAGSTITVTGCNYVPRETVSIDYNGHKFHFKNVKVGANGCFTTRITLPKNLTGNFQVVGTGSTGDKASAKLRVTKAGSSSGPSNTTLPTTTVPTTVTATVPGGSTTTGASTSGGNGVAGSSTSRVDPTKTKTTTKATSSHGVDAITTTRGSDGPLSATGVAVIGLGVIGLGLIGAGALFLLSGRRGRRAA